MVMVVVGGGGEFVDVEIDNHLGVCVVGSFLACEV